jgi:dTDP-4-amino-4,6-dideoxygalactose transaminase
MLIDEEAARKAVTAATRAIIPVSLFGNPLNHDFLFELRKEFEMQVIEDAACALGSSFRGEATGRQSDMTAFSFHPRKFITTGEGGLVVTHYEEWARSLQQYKHFGVFHSPETGGPVFQSVGTNYKMSDLLAALGVAQMEEIDLLLEERQRLAAGYDRMLKEKKNIRLPQTTPHGSHSYQSYVVQVPRRDEVMSQMRNRGVEVQIGTYALHRQPLFQNGHARLMGPFPGSMEAFSRSLTLPLFYGMTDAEQQEVVEILLQCVE